MNQSININTMENDHLSIPVTYNTTQAGLTVRLYLNKFNLAEDLGDGQKLRDTVGRRELLLRQQQERDGVFTYGIILDKHMLPNCGTYTGYIVAKLPDCPEPFEISNVNITVSPNPLHLKTQFTAPGGESQRTVAEIVSALYNHLYISPRYTQIDTNGKLEVTYSRKKDNEIIQLFRGDNGKLPLGSTYTILDKNTQNPVNGHVQAPLLNTDNNGRDIVSGCQIAKDQCPASYASISNLPCGEYIIFAEYMDRDTKQQTPHNEFKIH